MVWAAKDECESVSFKYETFSEYSVYKPSEMHGIQSQASLGICRVQLYLAVVIRHPLMTFKNLHVYCPDAVLV